MNINPISGNQSFEGKVIVKNTISKQQNHLFERHRQALEQKIQDMPFDLYVEQSKSKKTIGLSTNVKEANTYVVRKNKQNFEEAADLAIADAKTKSELYKKMVKVNEMFEYQKSVMLNVATGNFKDARNSEKQLAKLAVKDFDTYKEIPHVRLTNLSFDMGKHLFKQSIKYRLYRAFSPKTPEEKQFLQMKKEYINGLKAENKKVKTVEIPLPQFY